MRFFVFSEHVRGEPRIYYVCDRTKVSFRRDGQVSDHFTSKAKAEKLCDRMNADADNQQKADT